MQKDDWTLATLDEKDRAMLRFARKLNDTPSEVSVVDVEGLRSAAFTDQNIFDVVVIVAYFNFMNRIADGLGVVPEPEKQESYERHLREVMNSQRTAARPKNRQDVAENPRSHPPKRQREAAKRCGKPNTQERGEGHFD